MDRGDCHIMKSNDSGGTVSLRTARFIIVSTTRVLSVYMRTFNASSLVDYSHGNTIPASRLYLVHVGLQSVMMNHKAWRTKQANSCALASRLGMRARYPW